MRKIAPTPTILEDSRNNKIQWSKPKSLKWVGIIKNQNYEQTTWENPWVCKNYFTSNAEYIDVTIRLYKDDEVKGSFVFRDIKLADINNSILELTTDMEYEYVSGS